MILDRARSTCPAPGSGSGAAERSQSASMPDGSMYLRLDHSSHASQHTAPTGLTSDASEGKLWTTLDLRFISLFRRSCTLFVRMRRRCPAGKSRCASASAAASRDRR